MCRNDNCNDNEDKKSDGPIESAIKQYLKDNLTIEIKREISWDSSDRISFKAVLKICGDEISSSSFSFLSVRNNYED